MMIKICKCILLICQLMCYAFLFLYSHWRLRLLMIYMYVCIDHVVPFPLMDSIDTGPQFIPLQGSTMLFKRGFRGHKFNFKKSRVNFIQLLRTEKMWITFSFKKSCLQNVAKIDSGLCSF